MPSFLVKSPEFSFFLFRAWIEDLCGRLFADPPPFLVRFPTPPSEVLGFLFHVDQGRVPFLFPGNVLGMYFPSPTRDKVGDTILEIGLRNHLLLKANPCLFRRALPGSSPEGASFFLGFSSLDSFPLLAGWERPSYNDLDDCLSAS